MLSAGMIPRWFNAVTSSIPLTGQCRWPFKPPNSSRCRMTGDRWWIKRAPHAPFVGVTHNRLVVDAGHAISNWRHSTCLHWDVQFTSTASSSATSEGGRRCQLDGGYDDRLLARHFWLVAWCVRGVGRSLIYPWRLPAISLLRTLPRVWSEWTWRERPLDWLRHTISSAMSTTVPQSCLDDTHTHTHMPLDASHLLSVGNLLLTAGSASRFGHWMGANKCDSWQGQPPSGDLARR